MTKLTIKPPSADLFYVTIDGTRAIDSVAIGALWSTFGWKNLLSSLRVGASDRLRRIDTAHKHLPIRFVSEQQILPSGAGNTFADIVIMPEGVDGTGVDRGNWPSPDSVGNSGLINDANRFIQGFILSPSCDPAASSLGSGTRVADLVYISSHGVRTGDMFGAASNEIDEVDPFFILAKAAASSAGFVGVKWLVLSNCNTLVAETHNDWLALVAASPGFRGLLGYQGPSVPADASSAADVRFVKHLKDGASLRAAWRQANVESGMRDRWVVLCRDPAKDDTIAQWNSGTLPPVAAGSSVTLFDEGHQAGTPVVHHSDPFGVFWSKIVGGVSTKITPLNRYDLGNKITSSTASSASQVSITVTSAPAVPSFPAGSVIEITLIFVREDYPEPIDIDRMFTVLSTSGLSPTVTTLHRNDGRKLGSPPRVDPGHDTWRLTVPTAIASITITLRIDRLFLGDEHHNLPFWLRASFTAPDGSQTGPFDFIHDAAIYAR
jgi:Family of unknown function (DUF6345)